jgi:hypothetical protein
MKELVLSGHSEGLLGATRKGFLLYKGVRLKLSVRNYVQLAAVKQCLIIFQMRSTDIIEDEGKTVKIMID